MKILLAAHAPWRKTGYGTPVELTCRMWESLGHEVRLLAVDDRGPGLVEYHNHTVALVDKDQFGQDIIGALCEIWQIDVIVSLFDPWVLSPKGYSITGRPWIAWHPVDQTPPPYNLVEIMRQATIPLSFSVWGEKELQYWGVEKARSMPIAIDPQVFKPGGRKTARAMFNLAEDELVIGLAGSNLPGDRKALAENIAGAAMFLKEYGGQAKLLLNLELNGTIDVRRLVTMCGIQELTVYIQRFAKYYMLPEMADFYRACDVTLHASAAEGWGLCIAESMACGTPVIYTKNTSQPEVAGGAGIGIEPSVRMLSPQGGWWERPTAGDICKALEQFQRQRITGNTESENDCVKFASRFFPENLTGRWSEILEAVHEPGA